MPTPIDRNEVQRLISGDDAQLVEVLPEAEFAIATDQPRIAVINGSAKCGRGPYASSGDTSLITKQ
jgi:hypothetical protein